MGTGSCNTGKGEVGIMTQQRITRILGVSSFIAIASIWLSTQYIHQVALKTSPLSQISIFAVPAIMLWVSTRKGSIVHEKLLLMCSFLLAAAGDTLLSLHLLLPGIIAFLGSQIVNIVIFTRRIGIYHPNHITTGRTRLWRCLAGLIVACAYLVIMIPRIHGEATVVAIGVYTIMIVTMAVQAVSAYFAAPAGRTKQLWFRSAVGGIAQLISDTLLGFSMFVGPFTAHDLLVMTTYWLAIWLYAISLPPKK